MIQFINSKYTEGTKFVLWRLADYQYQIEITRKSTATTVEFNGEYYDALNKFDQVVQNFEEGATQNV